MTRSRAESDVVLMQVRIKKHRWHKRILKNNDPLIFSIGWRRFQSLPLLSLKTVVAGEVHPPRPQRH